MQAFVLALMVLLLWSAPVQAEPISAAIGLTALITSIGVPAAIAGSIGGSLIGIGLSVGLNFLVGQFGDKPGDSAFTTPVGVQTALRVGAAVPRNFIAGKQATAGKLDYWNLYGDRNQNLQLVFTLAAGPHDLFGVFVNGKRVTLGDEVGSLGRFIPEFDFDGTHCAWVKFYNGFYDQAVDPDLVNASVPAGRWSANNRGRGVCYARVTLVYVPEVWPQGIPQFLFEIGARLYDPRLDSTAGGAGSHRWNDQATWQHSENVALAAYLYERGLYVSGVKQVGRGLAPVDLVTDLFVGAANVCDEAVPLKGGGTEPRYRIAMNIGAERDYAAVEQDLCTAMAGWIMDTAGAYGPIAGAARPVAFTFSSRDLIAGRPVTFSQKRSRSELVNGIYGVYSDPAQNWKSVPYPARRSSADIATDGEEFAAEHDYLMIAYGAQAQRVGEIERQLSRHQVTAGLTLGFKFSNAEQGDWCTWTDSPVGALTFQITRYQLDAGQAITLTLRQISEDVFDFDPDVHQLDPLDPGDLPGIGALITTVPEFAAEDVQLIGPDGLQHPGIRCLWSPILDRTVDRVRVQYRLAAQPNDVGDAGPYPPEDGEGIIAAGVQAATQYEVRGTIDTTPLRLTVWTDWVPVTAASRHVVPHARNIAEDTWLSDFVTRELARRFKDINDVAEFIALHVVQQKVIDYESRIADKIELHKEREDRGAAVDIVQQAIDDLDGSFAAYQVSVNAALAANIANVTTLQQALAALDASFAQFSVTTNARLGAAEASTALNTSSLSTLNTAFAGFSVTTNARLGAVESSASINTTSIANLNQSFSSFSATTTASIGTLNTTVSINATAIATVDGRLAGSASMLIDVNGFIIGQRIYNNGSTGDVIFNVNNFLVAAPGLGSKPVFALSTVGGVGTMVLHGNIYGDNSIFGRAIFSDTLETRHLRADAATYTRSALGPNNTLNLNNTPIGHSIVSRVVDVLNGPSLVGGTAVVQTGWPFSGSTTHTGDSAATAIYVDGARIMQIGSAVSGGSPQGLNPAGTGLTHVLLGPGQHTVEVRYEWNPNQSTVGNPTRQAHVDHASVFFFEARNPTGT